MCSRLPEHEHRLLAFLIKLLEQNKRLLMELETAFLISVYDIQRVLIPRCVDVILFESGRENFVARVFETDTEGLEDFDGCGIVGGSV